VAKLITHTPDGYECPFCTLADGSDVERQREVVYRDDQVLAFISRHWWPNNPGHVLVVPQRHFENIYDLPLDVSDRIHRLSKFVAIAFKEVYHCDGVSTRQHNESAGNQHIWHYHLHIFPRYEGDDLYLSICSEAKAEGRVEYARKLKDYFEHSPPLLGI
jgi:histidine triad (HIT) family protein